MKIFQNVLVALAMAQDDERKVPPRTPAQRLNTLKRFAGEWVNLQIGVTINRPNRAQRMVDIGIERLESKMTELHQKTVSTLIQQFRTVAQTQIVPESDEELTGSNVNCHEFKEKSMQMTISIFSIDSKKT